MTIDDIYVTLSFCANKFLNGGEITPDEFNRIINIGQWNFLNWILGQFQDYQLGRPTSRVEFGVNMAVRERLSPLISTPMSNLSVDASGGIIWPDDYQRWDVFFTTSYKRIRPVQQHRLDSFLNSQIDLINENPIWLIENDIFRIYPNTNYNGFSIGNVLLSYIKTPPTINWASIPDPTTGLPVYNQSGSTNPIWFETDWWEIAARAGKMIGLNLESNQLSGYFDSIIKEGQ